MSDNRALAVLLTAALGVPMLLVTIVVTHNPGVLDGLGTALSALVGVSAFVVATVFEIKRLVDLPSSEGH